MQVIKSGAVTGVTEGTITDVLAGRVEIEPVGLPDDYQMNDEGDSGAVWLLKGSHRPVVLHQGGSAGPRRFAYGMPVLDVLAALNLAMLPVAIPARNRASTSGARRQKRGPRGRWRGNTTSGITAARSPRRSRCPPGWLWLKSREGRHGAGPLC